MAFGVFHGGKSKYKGMTALNTVSDSKVGRDQICLMLVIHSYHRKANQGILGIIIEKCKRRIPPLHRICCGISDKTAYGKSLQHLP